MRKIFMALAVFFAVSSTCFAAKPVNVCDFNADVFCKIYNRIVSFAEMPANLAIDEKNISTHSLQNGGIVLMPLKNFDGQSGTAISLSTDASGNISRIYIQSDSTKDEQDLIAAFTLTLVTAGLNRSDVDLVFKNQENFESTKTLDAFVPNINRCLKITLNPAEKDKIDRIEITAHD